MVKFLKKIVPLAAFFLGFSACGQGAEVEERAYLQLNYTEITLQIGEQFTLVPTLKETDVKPVYSFYCADLSVATVLENGVVTGVGEGKTTVRVQTSEHTASCSVTVIKGQS